MHKELHLASSIVAEEQERSICKVQTLFGDYSTVKSQNITKKRLHEK